MPGPVTEAKRRAIMERANAIPLYLDGEPCLVYGAKRDFAIVRPADLDMDKQVEFAWSVIERACDGDMQLRSK